MTWVVGKHGRGVNVGALVDRGVQIVRNWPHRRAWFERLVREELFMADAEAVLSEMTQRLEGATP